VGVVLIVGGLPPDGVSESWSRECPVRKLHAEAVPTSAVACPGPGSESMATAASCSVINEHACVAPAAAGGAACAGGAV